MLSLFPSNKVLLCRTTLSIFIAMNSNIGLPLTTSIGTHIYTLMHRLHRRLDTSQKWHFSFLSCNNNIGNTKQWIVSIIVVQTTCPWISITYTLGTSEIAGNNNYYSHEVCAIYTCKFPATLVCQLPTCSSWLS